jgi:hypothetical protein
MAKMKGMSRGPGSVQVTPKFGRARYAQILKTSWASERHDVGSGGAKQRNAVRKPGRYGGR